MVFEKAAEILHLLENAGHSSYIVGGYVRDSLLGRNPKDADIATSALPAEVCAITKTFYDVKMLHPKQAFPVVLVNQIEVATFRLDLEAEDRQNVKVLYSQSYFDDSSRRDFTINALYMNRFGEVFDPTGQGLDDLRDRVIRFVGNPFLRLKEDPLRGFRAIRFASRLGFSFADTTAEALCGFGEAFTLR